MYSNYFYYHKLCDLYNQKSRLGAMQVPAAKRLQSLEKEDRKRKTLLAEVRLEMAAVEPHEIAQSTDGLYPMPVVQAVAGHRVCAPFCEMFVDDTEKVPKTMRSLTEEDRGRTIDIHVGEAVRISLPENATTGYRWAIERYDEEFIEALASEPHYPANVPGSGGTVEFVFQAKRVGTGEIVLKYWRQWEGDQSVSTRFHVRLQVQP
jgi:inhibitor of cysteine peptidase